MEKRKPKLFSVMKTYTKEQFVKDVISGIIVAIIALPLSIALALASGVSPERGIYTAIVAGFLISFLGGSRVQIAGPTAAFATIVAGIVADKGMEGLAVATIMAGVILIVMGLFGVGSAGRRGEPFDPDSWIQVPAKDTGVPACSSGRNCHGVRFSHEGQHHWRSL